MMETGSRENAGEKTRARIVIWSSKPEQPRTLMIPFQFCPLVSVLTFVAFFFSTSVLGQQLEPGDIPDGSRAVPVHLINLYDETGSRVRLDDRPLMPFSTRHTCNPCHDYTRIRTGLHFNAGDSSAVSGREGEPWILVDPLTATQLPLSYRNWPGTFSPGQLGLTPWDFVQRFGRQMPGGGICEDDTSDPPELFLRRQISGKLEINCLACHSADPGQDQAEYASQIERQNFRWALTAASPFASVDGAARDMPDNFDIYYGVAPDLPEKVPPTVEYDQSRFNHKGKVLFNLVRKIPNERCYFCHSTRIVRAEPSARWLEDEDVHLAAGMKCVDCHRNGLDHKMIRGYEGEAEQRSDPKIAEFSCKGCHLGTGFQSGGRIAGLGAPVARHRGLPPVHFEKLTCTACHSGPAPEKYAYPIKTSRAHALGTHHVLRDGAALPSIQEPVFVLQEDGKIAPHRLLWPSFWAYLSGDSLKPILPDSVAPIIFQILSRDTLNDSTNFARIQRGTWPVLPDSALLLVLLALSQKHSLAGTPAYLGGGKMFFLTKSGKFQTRFHPAAQPYSWPLAHDVRPAAQSLGSGGCNDCHSLSSPFYFGRVTIPSPFSNHQAQFRSMNAFTHLGRFFPRLFALSFLFRPWLKFLILASAFLIASILILFFFKAIDAVLQILAENE